MQEPAEPVDEEGFRLRAAALLRGAANDLKRDDRAAAADLEISAADFAAYADGSRAIPAELLRKAAAVWPVNESDLLPWRDDCPDGILVRTAAEAAATSRVLRRGGTDYYEYRDTAMSRLAGFRPEWIRMLAVVDDDDPAHPAVRWNRGHLLYQFTYFVGPVNYYHREPDGDRILRMSTGDSVWGLPYAPHTFTSRNSAEDAYILALTYGGELLGDVQRELAALGPASAGCFPRSTAAGAFAALLRDFLDAAALPPGELSARTGFPAERLAEFLEGLADPDPAETEALARALRVPPRELMPVVTDGPGMIRHCPARAAREWLHPSADRAAYRIRELAGSSLHPHTRALEIIPVPGAAPHDLRTYQHQYLYNVGGSPAEVHWRHGDRSGTARLAHGDSAYLKPFTGFALTAESAGCRVLSLRIGGRVTTESRFALGGMYPDSLPRYLRETGSWY
ncbi:XRE family transcriptional regulator [Actinomadura sp. 9N215]|uniref:XRE family transcriptional regulator n=1 Tax=Actinomadura sp. 9N215 TaxID=3375150 RepID=UPI00378A97C6